MNSFEKNCQKKCEELYECFKYSNYGKISCNWRKDICKSSCLKNKKLIFVDDMTNESNKLNIN